MNAPLEVPRWVTEWFNNDPHGQRLASVRFRAPVSTAAERELARRFVRTPGHPCTSCGGFSFPAPTLCYWCRR